MDKEELMHKYNGILFRCKKEIFPFATTWMDLEVVLLGCIVFLFLGVWGTSILLSTGAASIYIPTNSVGGFPFLYNSPTLVISCLLESGHSDWYKAITLLIFISLMISDASFHVSVGQLYFLFGKVCSGPPRIFFF